MEGKVEGLEEGLEKGREEGELKAKLEMVRHLKKMGMDSESIAQITGLNLQDIEGLYDK